MTASIKFRPEALSEFNDSVDWYESRQIGLGARFVNAIDAAMESLRKYPEHQAVVYKDVRLKSVKGFPYQTFYRIKEDASVEVLSVFHVRQYPEIWRERSRSISILLSSAINHLTAQPVVAGRASHAC